MNKSNYTMRDSFINAIGNFMESDEKIWFLTADLGAPALDKIRNCFPTRFINTGLSEQNLVNLATGLALEGAVVYGYAIAPFITMRAYEQIRVNLAISSQKRAINVNLIGLGAGLSYPVSGPTHHCLEDIAIMRLLPGMSVISPSDSVVTEAFAEYTIRTGGPKYLRFDAKPLPVIYDAIPASTLANGFCELKKGKDVCLIATGIMTHKALSVAETLSNIGVVDLFMPKPCNQKLLLSLLSNYTKIITLEEGLLDSGGIDSFIRALLADCSPAVTIKSVGFSDRYIFDLGSREALHKIAGIDLESICRMVVAG